MIILSKIDFNYEMLIRFNCYASLLPDIDDCVGVSCSNNGTCVDMVDDYTCNCVEGFTGQHCETGTRF